MRVKEEDDIVDMGYNDLQEAIVILEDAILLFTGLSNPTSKESQLIEDLITTRNQLNFHLLKKG